MTNNKYVLSWIDEMAAMTKPDKIVWIDGTDAQAEALRAEACSTGEIIKLNQELLPNCYLHRTAINDVARVEGRTFICTRDRADAGNINNWMDPVFVLGGRQDKVVTGTASAEIAERLGCKIHMYEGLGHAAYEEAGDFNQKVYEFMIG